MAHNVEPMDIDNIDSDFDNKENSIHHSNVYPRTPCTEKGYEELDVSELNMKLRYSITPAASPMSRSFTANCADNRSLESGDDTLNANLTRSLHSAFSKGDMTNKSVKTLPLQTISTEQLADSNRNTSVLRQLDSTVVVDNNVTVSVTHSNDIEENISFPSSSSSTVQTPEATTPTKEIPRTDGGSPIMRGLKSVLNMFRSSQSPIPPVDNAEAVSKQVLSPADISTSTPDNSQTPVLASTPIAAHKYKDGNSSKRSSPHKESLVFNEDLEKELLWKDETTILFSQEKIPIHKLFLQPAPNYKDVATNNGNANVDDNLNSTVEYMDISYNDSIVKNKTITDLQTEGLNESDGEFVDCETTFTNDKSGIKEEVIQENEPNLQVLSTTIDVPVNVETAPPLKSDAQLTSNYEIEVEFKQIKDDVSVNMEKTVTDHKYEEPIHNLNTSVSGVNSKMDETNTTQVLSTSTAGPVVPEPPSNFTFITCNLPTEDVISSIINSTQILSDVDKAHFAVSQDNVSNSTFVQQSSSSALHNVCNTTYNAYAKPEDGTFVKESVTENSDVCNTTVDVNAVNNTFVKQIASESVAASDVNTTTTITPIVEDATFVKEIDNTSSGLTDTTFTQVQNQNVTFSKDLGSVTLPSDHSHTKIATDVENATFVKANEIVCADSDRTSNVGYNTFVQEIKNYPSVEEKVNTSTPSTETDVHDSPANIPLPDEDDIENEKSLGASMLAEEKTIPDRIDIYNSPDIKLENENKVEKMPIDIAKSMNVNSSINYAIGEKESVTAINIDNEIKLTGLPDIYSNETTDHSIMQEEKQTEVDTNDILPQDMDINESIIVQHPMAADIQQSILANACCIQPNLDVTMEQVTSTVKDVQPVTTVLVTDVIHAHTEIPKACVTESSQSVQNFDTVTVIQAFNITADRSEINVIKDFKTAEYSQTKVKSTENVTAAEDTNKISEIPVTIVTGDCHFEENVCDVDMPTLAEETKETRVIPINNTTTDVTDNILAKLQADILDIKSSIGKHQEIIPHEIATVTEVAETKTTASEQNATDVVIAAISDKTIDELPLDQVASSADKILPLKDITAAASECTNVNNDLPIETHKPIIDDIKIEVSNINNEKEVDNPVEEIVVSENNSPFVSIAGQIDPISNEAPKFEEGQNPFATKSRVVLTPPASPKIVSKGYNFNFDEIDDPFATKTKIRMSPTPDTSPKEIVNTTFEEMSEAPKRDINKNRRKSQPERKRPVMPKKKLNSTFSGSVKATKSLDSKQELTKDIEPKSDVKIAIQEKELAQTGNNTESPEISAQNIASQNTIDIEAPTNTSMTSENSTSEVPKEQTSLDDRDVDTTDVIVESKASVESLNTVLTEAKTSSSSEQSAYYSAGTSSGEGSVNRNVFNIPEIDDMNFNPFVTKSKMRQSPPPGVVEDVTNQAADFTTVEGTKAKTDDFEELKNKVSETIDDKESADVSNTTCSSKATDEKDVTVREVNTEDEDTEEGPFLEVEENDKMSDFDGEDVDMMQFSELPPPNNDENLDPGEMFIDAEAFEFLLNQNKSNVVSDSGKESLFLKFDPLFAKRVSTDGMLAALNKVQKRQSTPKKMAPQAQMDSTFAMAGPSNLNVTHELGPNIAVDESPEDLNITVSKPMMVVTPAVNSIVTPRNKTTTPVSSNRRSITFTSPAIAVIDRLLSLSANNSLLGHDTTVTVSREQSEADQALTQLRELLAEKEINVYNLRTETKELKDRLLSLESQMRTLETESEQRLRKVNELNEKLSEKTKINKSMAAVVEEYERTIASLIAETEQDKKRHNEERIRLIKERDEQTAHLASMEVSFSDLHSKYEKSKQIILTCKANEDSYKKSIKEFEENLSKMQSNYELLKQHATSKLNHANQELEKMNRAHESEVLKMNAMIKRKELHITSLEETLAQKTKANEELTAICDELINKVG